MSAIDSLSFHADGNSIRARFVTRAVLGPWTFKAALIQPRLLRRAASHSAGKLIDKRALFPLPPNDPLWGDRRPKASKLPMTTMNYKTLSGTCRHAVEVLEQGKQLAAFNLLKKIVESRRAQWTAALYQMVEVNFNHTQFSRTANQRRAEDKVLGSLTPLAYLLSGRSRLPHAREHVAAIDLEPSSALTISRSSVGHRPYSFRAFFEGWSFSGHTLDELLFSVQIGSVDRHLVRTFTEPFLSHVQSNPLSFRR
jgi:hypothetical protein